MATRDPNREEGSRKRISTPKNFRAKPTLEIQKSEVNATFRLMMIDEHPVELKFRQLMIGERRGEHFTRRVFAS